MRLSPVIISTVTVATALSSVVNSQMQLTSKLKINIPQSLSKPDGYNHREALFGVSPYGGAIQAKVYYVDDTLCGQSDVDRTKAYPRDDSGTWESPFILMVNRGECTFVQKVRNGQHSGAAGVLIADHTCICGDPDCSITNGEIVCETQEPIMADDGSGGDISIPSFLLYKKDADKFIEELKANRPMQAEMSWSMPQPDGHVEYELFTTPTDPVSKQFLLQWQKVAIALGERAYFTPHMFIYDGVRAGCQGTNGTSNCYNLCTNSGRYCGTDPDNDLNAGISGADVVRESLRRICIWNIYGAPDGIGKKYWQYMEQFNARCNNPDYFMDLECIKDVYKHSDMDGDRVESCMTDSGATTSDAINNKMENEISQQAQQGVIIIPSAFVNGAVIRGALNVNNIFSAICSGFADGTTPDVCRCNGCADVVGCVDNKLVCKAGSSSTGTSYSTYSSDDDSVSYRSFTISILLLIGTLSTIGFMYYKRSKETVRNHVRDILAEYMPLQDSGDSPRMGMTMPQQQQYAPQYNMNNFVNQMTGGGAHGGYVNPNVDSVTTSLVS